MDKMTVNMIAGAVLSALLVIFGSNTAIDILYPRGGGPQAPVEAHASAATTAPAAAEAAQPLPVLLASGTAEAGANVVKKCAACHTFDEGGANKIGPNLHGVVGRPVASHAGFAYSEALKTYGGNWDYEKLNCFLTNPKACVPGNKMAFAGLNDKDRANAIAYLRSVSPAAPPLPAASAEPAAPAAAQASADPAAPAPAAPAQN